MIWVVVSDLVLGGVILLGFGLGCDFVIVQGKQEVLCDCGMGWLVYEECSFEVYCVYYEVMFKGCISISYMVCLNNVGEFNLLFMWVEVMYVLEMFGEVFNGKLVVKVVQ